MVETDPRASGGRRVGADRKLSSERELELVTAFLRGDKIRIIEGVFDVTKPTIYKILDRRGVQRARRQKGAGPHETQPPHTAPEGT